MTIAPPTPPADASACAGHAGAGRPGAIRLVLVGGFLGAGKTTLMHAAARRLQARGRRVGLITNDQARGLVDTTLLRQHGFAVREVAGSCFCCGFPDLLAAAESLHRDLAADLILAEPVGSCTDLSATILQPLKERYRNAFSCAPLSVLCDAPRLARWLDGAAGIHPGAAHIFHTQLSEADLLVLSKCDSMSADALAGLRARLALAYPGRPMHTVSARDGIGIDDWLDALAAGPAGTRIAEVDYDIYAAGEAALGWLNGEFVLRSATPRSWRTCAIDLIADLQARCRQRNAAIGHIKLILRVGDEHLATNVVSADEIPRILGSPAAIAREASLTLNARIEMTPSEVEKLARAALATACGSGIALHISSLHSLSPARPQPTHRYGRAVAP
jgi:Ni2+-binding GTPase involved in maturation of urease and hydrogenase